MKNPFNILLLIVFFFIIGCKNEIINDTISYNIIGNVQKGPFSNGSELSIFELDNNLFPTGRTFHTTISNLGKFELNNVSLISPYVELVANGFYFNEISGELSSSPLTLRAIVSLSNLENANVNLLTDIEYERVRYLITNKNLTFNDAKKQALNEILNIFNLSNITISNPEMFDISQTSEGDAILLAVSVILQGNLLTAELSKLLSDIVTDLKTDGILNNTIIQNTLFSQASLLNIDVIKKNIKTQYQEFGVTLDQLNNFDSKIDTFIHNSTYQFVSPFIFPEKSSLGTNILYIKENKFNVQKYYTLAVQMPSYGKIKIIVRKVEGAGHFLFSEYKEYGWISNLNVADDIGTYVSDKNSCVIETMIGFTGYGIAQLEFYYNDNVKPDHVRTITWGAYSESNYYFALLPWIGINLLTINDSTELRSDSIYIVAMESLKKEDYNVHFTLINPSTATIETTGGFGNHSYTLFNDRIEFNLQGPTETYIALKMKGEGTLNLTSDLQLKNGTLLKRTFFLKH